MDHIYLVLSPDKRPCFATDSELDALRLRDRLSEMDSDNQSFMCERVEFPNQIEATLALETWPYEYPNHPRHEADTTLSI